MTDGPATIWKLSPENLALLEDEVRAVLAEADADIAARKPVCRSSGLCCKFEEYGHRLYVTHAELAHFSAALPQEAGKKERASTTDVSLPMFFARETIEGCPYQVQGLCTARSARPLGCRVYFCDASAQAWQNDVYEHYHGKLKALHEKYGMPYGYVEWREGLKMIAQHQAPAGTGSGNL